MRIPEAVVVERDARMFEMRKAGMNYRAIAAASNVSVSTAYSGVNRVMKQIGRQLVEDHGDVVRMELERLDTLQRQLWPMTRPHKIVTGDGEEIEIPPSLDAIDRVLKIMDRRAKLMGLDQAAGLAITMGDGNRNGTPAFGVPEKVSGQISPESEARKLLEVALATGVISAEALGDAGLAGLGFNPEDIIEAEVVEDSYSAKELEPGAELDEETGEIIPPPWMEDDDLADGPELPSVPWAEDDDRVTGEDFD